MRFRSRLILITDVGEEIDDELALFSISQWLSSRLWNRLLFQVSIIFVNGRIPSSQRKARFHEVLQTDGSSFEHLLTSTELEEEWTSEEVCKLFENAYVLQIAPCEFQWLFSQTGGGGAEEFVPIRPRMSILAGSYKQSLNYNGSGVECELVCEHLLRSARKCVILDSVELSKSKISDYCPREDLLLLPAPLREAIAMLTYRFLVGRAFGDARHVAHLASDTIARIKGRKASNKEAMRQVYLMMTGKDIHKDALPVGESAWRKANIYVSGLSDFDNYCHNELGFDSKDVIISEYAQLFQAVEDCGFQADLPNEVLSSHDPILSDDSLRRNRPMGYERFYTTYFLKRSSPLPAYDVTAWKAALGHMRKDQADQGYNCLKRHSQFLVAATFFWLALIL